jgi:hypothetical protein
VVFKPIRISQGWSSGQLAVPETLHAICCFFSSAICSRAISIVSALVSRDISITAVFVVSFVAFQASAVMEAPAAAAYSVHGTCSPAIFSITSTRRLRSIWPGFTKSAKCRRIEIATPHRIGHSGLGALASLRPRACTRRGREYRGNFLGPTTHKLSQLVAAIKRQLSNNLPPRCLPADV